MAKEYIERSVLREIYLSSKRENTHHTQEAGRIHQQEYIHILDLLDKAPAADVVEVVRCRDCKFYNNHALRDVVFDADACHWNADEQPDPDDFCSAGERKDGADNANATD